MASGAAGTTSLCKASRIGPEMSMHRMVNRCAARCHRAIGVFSPDRGTFLTPRQVSGRYSPWQDARERPRMRAHETWKPDDVTDSLPSYFGGVYARATR